MIRYAALAVVSLGLLGGAATAGTLAPDAVKIEDGKIAASLTGKPGDPVEGRKWFADRKLGNCLACHQNADLSEQQFHGEVGPTLDGVADRWTPEELRAIVVNSKAALYEGTIMPAFYRTSGLNRVADNFAGKTILSAQQVEDVVAYLMTLKEE
ncbi:MAG: sulfur oxidation c-type cytochrome SoxX [Alphaproteobacteria bacterium]|nr:sulfur oxidation c-type cytochrome SoxX [Alphaproteobacteria bacterium]